MSDITLPRAVAEKLRKALFDWAECHNDVADFCDDDKEILAALEAALAEPTAKPEPVVVEQLFALAKLTVRRAADPDPWVWDRLSDDGTWTPFNPLIHGPDMWRLEQALRAALAEPDATREPEHPGYIIGSHWLETAYSRIAAGEVEAEVLAEVLGARGWATQEPATHGEISEKFYNAGSDRHYRQTDYRLGWRAAERFHGIRKEDK